MALQKLMIARLKIHLPKADDKKVNECISHVLNKIDRDDKLQLQSESSNLNSKQATSIVVGLRDYYVFSMVEYLKDSLLGYYETLDPRERESLKVFKRVINYYDKADDKNAAVAAILIFRDMADLLIEKYNIEKEVVNEIKRKPNPNTSI